MRLEPIARPRSLFMRLAYWMSRRQFGEVITPMKVLYARNPKLATPTWQIGRTMEKGLSLPRELVLLVTTQSSQQNGCTFCADLHRAQAVQARIGLDKFRDLARFRESPHFDERERAALAYTEEVTRDRSASDATFDRLQKHFSEREIVDLTWLNAIGNFFNLMAVPLEIESDELLARQTAGEAA